MHRFARLLLLAGLVFGAPACAQQAPKSVPPAEVAGLLQQPQTVLLDVRTPQEFAAGHLQGARNLDFRAPDFRQQIAQLDKTKTYVLYCASGNRSGQTATLMQQAGFQHTANAGGFQALKAAGLPAE